MKRAMPCKSERSSPEVASSSEMRSASCLDSVRCSTTSGRFLPSLASDVPFLPAAWLVRVPKSSLSNSSCCSSCASSVSRAGASSLKTSSRRTSSLYRENSRSSAWPLRPDELNRAASVRATTRSMGIIDSLNVAAAACHAGWAKREWCIGCRPAKGAKTLATLSSASSDGESTAES